MLDQVTGRRGLRGGGLLDGRRLGGLRRGLLGRRGLLALGAAIVAGAAGIVSSQWLGGRLDNTASSAVITGIVAALLGCFVFAVIVLVIDRGFVKEIRGLLAGRNGADGRKEES